MKTLSKPIGEYPSWEALREELIHTDDYLNTPASARVNYLNQAKDYWTTQHAHLAEKAGASEKDLTQKADEIISKVLKLVGGGLPGPIGSVNQALPDFAKSMLPQDNTQAIIDLALLGVGSEAIVGKTAYRILMGNMLKRIASTTAVGAAAGATQGTPSEGATRGFLEGLGGEAAMGALRTGGYYARKYAMPSLDFKRVAGWLEGRFETKIPDQQTFDRLFKEGQIANDTEKWFDTVHRRVKQRLGKGFRVEVPMTQGGPPSTLLGGSAGKMKVDMSLDNAVQHLHTLENEGWNLRGRATTSATGAAARDAAHEFEGEIARSIADADPKAGTLWYNAHGRLKEAKALRNFFNYKGAIDESGNLNMSLLQHLVSDDSPTSHRYDLIQAMGPELHEDFRKMLFRGAEAGSLTDRPGKFFFGNPRMSLHMGVYGHPQLPYPARHVGDVPFDFGGQRILRSLATIGPYSLLQNLSDMTAGPHETIPGYVPGSGKVAGVAGEVAPTIAPTAATSAAK